MMVCYAQLPCRGQPPPRARIRTNIGATRATRAGLHENGEPGGPGRREAPNTSSSARCRATLRATLASEPVRFPSVHLFLRVHTSDSGPHFYYGDGESPPLPPLVGRSKRQRVCTSAPAGEADTRLKSALT